MTSISHPTKIWMSFAVVLIFSIMTMTADRYGVLSEFRTGVHDFLTPGRLVVASISSSGGSDASASGGDFRDRRLTELENELNRIQEQRRQLLIENSRLNNELRLLGANPAMNDDSERLTGFEVIPAQVLSQRGMPTSLQELFIDAGRTHGLRRSELVLDGEGMLLDEGAQAGIAGGHQVLMGRTVVGRIARTGRWVSQVQSVTNPEYSSRVRLVRHSRIGADQTASRLATGILEGTGTDCRVVGVSSTDSVAVGDEVISADIDGIAGPGLYFGRVASAQFEPGGEWTILVEPAANRGEIQAVTVVCPKLNASKIEFNPVLGSNP